MDSDAPVPLQQRDRRRQRRLDGDDVLLAPADQQVVQRELLRLALELLGQRDLVPR